MNTKTKFIFITGGVVSSLGKGLTTAALGALLQARGYKTRLRKLDPYLNVDPGTMSPIQHGEVFVTDDGAETDLDLGHYERFTDIDSKKSDNITAGQIYFNLISKERRGDYLGGTVQVIPHVTNLIKEFIFNDLDNIDFALCEIGGTVGDIEALPFFEAIRQIGFELGKERCIFVHLTLLPYIFCANELKTKPTQHSVKELRSIGIQPNILLCRTEHQVYQTLISKIARLCSIEEDYIVIAPNASNIYEIPSLYHSQNLDNQLLKYFNLKDEGLDLSKWNKITDLVKCKKHKINLAIAGKYIDYKDSYKSLLEAIDHASLFLSCEIKISWINTRNIKDINHILENVDAILVPGGFGQDGVEGKIKIIKYARENKVPYLGICLGMQMTIVEFARNVLNIKDAISSEFNKNGTKVIGLMKEWEGRTNLSKNLGGTMRLGSYPCKIKKKTLGYRLYNQDLIYERHRHRYEVNISFKEEIETKGLIFSGISPDGKLAEIIELNNHPFFIGVQFHPELKSRPFNPHPLFVYFIKQAIDNKNDN